MTPKRWVARRVVVAAMLHASLAQAGVWTTDPTLGLSGEYSTNPVLLNAPHTSETHGAVLIDTPTTFNGDAVRFFVDPSVRISDSSGYSSIASDYAHLSMGGEIDTERNSLAITGQIARDSSLYYTYTVNGSTGVRRDSSAVDLTWTRSLTERLKFNLDVNPSRVLYADTRGITTLTDYRYTSAAPGLVWNTSERTSLTLTGGVGLYDSINGRTKSVNSQLQVGFSRQLNELWSLTANAGYSRETNKISQDVFAGYEIQGNSLIPVFVLETFKSSNAGTVFNANLTRKGELLAVTALATRSVVPTGFAFLARQSSYQLSVEYPYTPRWTFDGHVRWLKSVEPQVFGTTASQSNLDFGLSASWLLTEQWTFKMSVSRVTAKYSPPPVSVAANGFTLQLARKFNGIVWH
jgi:hypothetical protein